MADSATSTGDKTLEAQLEEMLEIEKFDPPEEFVKNALLNDPSIYEEAEKDWKGWWLKQAKELHWFKEPTETARRLQPAVLQVVHRRQAQRVVQLPGPPRRGGQR